ncbi:hypothetical protein [Bradyrhizobium neotropicale]|uniref:hypothetical protein n=1 Tax=Bradyrhizobium neotropicale TaxID=1497615 RepID=UPI001AD7DED3|nr:hypothetical protein [Bradyrhizobium neotropicale]MBO4228030.1 hypothetical protein [Bradyrhizobium neotropicale]
MSIPFRQQPGKVPAAVSQEHEPSKHSLDLEDGFTQAIVGNLARGAAELVALSLFLGMIALWAGILTH